MGGDSRIELYWLPLGAGGPSVVRVNGRAFEAVQAAVERRPRCDLYHAALELTVAGATFAIEIAPVPDAQGERRGVVAEGAVGSRLAQGLRIFRYELRCWRDGVIPDLAEAVESPRLLSGDEGACRRILDLLPVVPMPVWGRDELGAGEMWTSNSVISWLLAGAALPAAEIRLPRGGRAPGWDAGLRVAGGRP